MMNETRHIDLHLPRSWNQCSLTQLRAIADIMVTCSLNADHLHPFDMYQVKVGVFFRLTGLKIIEPINPRVPVEDQYYQCRLLPYSLDDEHRWCGLYRRWRTFRAWFSRSVLGRDDSFSLYLWQIDYWLRERKEKPRPAVLTPIGELNKPKERIIPGMLDWLNGGSADAIMRFPLPDLHLRRHPFGRRHTFRGPNPMMDGFSWQRYRFCQDFMQLYADQQNQLVRLARQGRMASPDELLKAARSVDLAKAMFLATIFERRLRFVDETTGRPRTDFCYQSNQHSDNAPYFRNFPDGDWQLILLWWQSMMHYLAKQFPKVYKRQPVSSTGKTPNPLEIYTRTTATLEKYLQVTAHDIEREPYTTILQQLEDITNHNEEMERIQKQMKRKKH